MGGDSCSKGREFESRHRIFTFICFVGCNVCLKRRKYMKKRPGLAHLKTMLPISRLGANLLIASNFSS